MPLRQSIILSSFPKHLQPTAIVLWEVGAVFGPIVGPVIGSMMAELYDWRAAFFYLSSSRCCYSCLHLVRFIES